TIYAFGKRALIVPFLEVLDFCDTARSVAHRNVTSIPTQALTLHNGDFVNSHARHMAHKLPGDSGGDRRNAIQRAYLPTHRPEPTRDECFVLGRFLEEESRNRLAESAQAGAQISPGAAQNQALVQVCRALFNTNEFVYPD